MKARGELALLALIACRAPVAMAPPAVNTAAAPPAAATTTAADECREDNPVPVRLVRLAQSELLAHLAHVLGKDVVSGKGAPSFLLQGDHVHPAGERPVNSVDFASYRSAARVLAQRWLAALPPASPCLSERRDDACIDGPLKRVVEDLYRGVLDVAAWAAVVHEYHALRASYGPGETLEAVLTAALLSPQVLYRAESAQVVDAPDERRLSREEAISFASFALRGRPADREDGLQLAGIPDDRFPEGLARLARHFTSSEDFRVRATAFLREWFGVSHLGERLVRLNLPGGGGGKPDISNVLIEEFDGFVADNFLSRDGDLGRLFTANQTRYFRELEGIYTGVFVTGDRIVWDPRERKGVLGLSGVLAAHAKEQSSDPVQRGMLVRQRLLCEPMPPPVPNADLGRVGITDRMQTRERYEALATAPACRSCHMVINPPGYLFEGFDQFGRRRTIEKGRAVDDRGGIPAFFGEEPYPGAGEWAGITDLADWLAQTPRVRQCFAKDFSNYLLAERVFDRPDNCALAAIAARFTRSGRIADLVEDIVRSETFRRRLAASKTADR